MNPRNEIVREATDASISSAPVTTAERPQIAAQPRGLRSPLRGFFMLAPGQALGQAVAFVMLVVVARTVGPANLGIYQFALSALTYFSLASNLGITTLAIRDVSADHERARETTGEVLLIRLTLAVLSFACLIALAPYITPSHNTAIILDILGVMLIAEALAGEWLLQAYQRLGTVALAALARQLIVAAITIVILTQGFAGIERYTVITVTGALFVSTVTAVSALRIVGLPRLDVSLSRLWTRCRRSLPFSWSFVMIQIYYATDYVILGFLKGPSNVGQYGVAYRLPSIVIGVISLWSAAAYPYLVRRGTKDRAGIHDYIGRTTTVALILASGLIAITLPVGHELIGEIFGARFAPAGTAFVILMANAGVIIASVNLMNVLLAMGDERHYAIAVTGGAIVNTALNFALIPAIGTTGAATATLCAELVVFFYMLRRIQALTGRISLQTGRVARGLAAAIVAGGTLFAYRGLLPALADIAIGGTAFVGLVLALRVLTRDELISWRSS